jgi:Restriction endonuclease
VAFMLRLHCDFTLIYLEFEIDALVRFEFLGAEFLVLVECKHHRNRLKRELVQVLRDRVRSVSAHKGILFSTGGFQKGAVEYAQAQKITLVHFTEGGPIYETNARGGHDGPRREYDDYVVTLTGDGTVSYRFGDYEGVTNYIFGLANGS